MLCEVLEYVFVNLSANQVIGKVLGYNDASIKLHERLGFDPDKKFTEEATIALQESRDVVARSYKIKIC